MGQRKIKTIYLLIATIGLIGFLLILFKQRQKDVKQVLIKSTSVCDEILKDYELEPVKRFEGTPAPVNFTKFPEAKQYYTVIIESAALGPNYAGHFSFISWGCGTSNFSYAIVDLITGDIVAYPSYCTEFIALPSYDIDSRLLVFNPKDQLIKLDGRNITDLISNFGYLAGSEREYYLIKEKSDSSVWIDKICSENVLDGVYSESQ
mgnify:CR=1 FL=1